MNNNLKKIKENVSIYQILNKYNIDITSSSRVCKCPFHNDNKPSMGIFKDNKFRCYACGKSGDVVDFVRFAENCDFKKAMELIIKMFKLEDINVNDKDYKPSVLLQTGHKENKHFRNASISSYITDCMFNIDKTQYFQHRGLLKKTIKEFHLGYDKEKDMVIIPYNNAFSYYQSRSADFITKKFYKPPNKITGTEPIFNYKVFYFAEIIFVVESPICAMSVWQCGGQSVALCGVGNYKKVISLIKRTNYKGTLVLSLDNDAIGELTSLTMAKEFDKIGVKYVIENIAGEYKDPNELLMANWNRLKININQVINKIKNKKEG